MTKPDFVAQSAEPMTGKERRAWFDCRAIEMRDRGASWLQFSVDGPEAPTITLAEGWKERPPIQPAPHFQMTYVEDVSP